MKVVLREMKKKKNRIPEDVLFIFEGIVKKCEKKLGPNLVGLTCFNPEWDDEFSNAMIEHLTKEQRFQLYEEAGACNGAGSDKKRKAFALENAHLDLDERMELFAEKFKRWKPVLNDDNTLTLNFKCSHGYYKRAKERKYTIPPPNVESYFEDVQAGDYMNCKRRWV